MGWRRAGGLAAAATALVLSATGAAGAAEPLQVGDPRLRDVRTPAEHPNISGVWNMERYGLRITPMEGGDPPWLPWAEKVFRDRAQAELEGVPQWDPTGACYGSGIPRILSIGYPNEIVQTQDKIVWINESQHVFRVIHMDAEHPANPEPTLMGHAVGRWEGETLVVDTVGISGRGQIDERGTPQTDELRVVERITRKGDVLENVFTITDPGAYSRPWTVKRTYRFAPGQRLMEYVCEENNRNPPDAEGNITTILR